MELRIYPKDRIRITSDYKGQNFIDTEGMKDEIGMSIDLYPSFHYIEMREKDGMIRVFLFQKKGLKKYYDFGYWKDAEVVYSLNKVIKK